MLNVDIDPHNAHSQRGGGYWHSHRKFRAARRHSRIVRALRILIPSSAIVSAIVIVLFTYFNPLRSITKLPINIDDLIVSGTKITMQAPHLSGFTRDSRAYELSAAAAAQDLTKPDIVELRDLRAKVALQDETTMEMSAAFGVYNNKSETVKLERDIKLSTTNGYEGYLSEATIDIRQGSVLSEKPVKLKMLQGTLDANKLEIVESGNLVRFFDGVVMDLMLSHNAATAKPESGAN